MTTDPITLAARVEALTGPCRETDAEIDWTVAGYKGVHPQPNPYGDTRGFWRAAPDAPMQEAPAYTASLDAAMTLAEPKRRPDLMWEAMRAVSRKFDLHMCFFPDDADYGQEIALALTAAALRAQVRP